MKAWHVFPIDFPVWQWKTPSKSLYPITKTDGVSDSGGTPLFYHKFIWGNDICNHVVFRCVVCFPGRFLNNGYCKNPFKLIFQPVFRILVEDDVILFIMNRNYKTRSWLMTQDLMLDILIIVKISLTCRDKT